MAVKFVTPVSRLVQGLPHEFREQEDDKGNKKLDSDGTVVTQAYVGIAVEPNDPLWLAEKAKIEADAEASWVPKGVKPKSMKAFAWKFFDGDSEDKFGVKRSEKNPAMAGKTVIGLTRGGKMGPPQMYVRSNLLPEGHMEKDQRDDAGNFRAIQIDVATAQEVFKRGYRVRAFGEAKSNESSQTPGMYLNLIGIEMVAYDEEIIVQGGPSYEEMFGGNPAPAATPPSPKPAASAPPTASPSSPPLPYSGHMAPPPPAVPTGPKLTPAAEAAYPGATVEMWNAAGWTEEQLKANGYLA